MSHEDCSGSMVEARLAAAARSSSLRVAMHPALKQGGEESRQVTSTQSCSLQASASSQSMKPSQARGHSMAQSSSSQQSLHFFLPHALEHMDSASLSGIHEAESSSHLAPTVAWPLAGREWGTSADPADPAEIRVSTCPCVHVDRDQPRACQSCTGLSRRSSMSGPSLGHRDGAGLRAQHQRPSSCLSPSPMPTAQIQV